MAENTFKDKVEQGLAPNMAVMQAPSMLYAEAFSRMGFDAIYLDVQHGAFAYEQLYSMAVAVDNGSATAACRVPWNEPSSIMKALDAGIHCVICPMVNNRAEAEAFVQACRYAPRGYRSFGPVRAGLDPEYFAQANDVVMTIAQIETVEGVDNLEEIVSTPGLDSLYPGPGDMSICFEEPFGLNYDVPKTADRLKHIIEVAHEHDVYVGLPAMTAEDAEVVLEWGADWYTIGGDAFWLRQAAAAALEGCRSVSQAHAAAR